MNKYLHHPCTLPDYDIIVFCHLRWDFVYQRPQHILSRLSKEFKILFVEEPVDIYSSDKSYISIQEISDKLHVCKPLVKNLEELGLYLKQHLSKTECPVGWFYSAAFVPILKTLQFDTIVYDCMDELSLFKGASPDLLNQETALLAAADIVFTGGKSLYEAKAQKHDNVFCFPSSVHVDHFSQAGIKSIDRPYDLQNLLKPIIGYYGVIDERIDYQLIKETAQSNPAFDFVMVGPVCKVDERDLPKGENIHYLGPKKYEELPQYLNFFDIAMMPFALNDSTRYISPTKTLEYMAANKPIISTKIKDVVRDYGACINLVTDAVDFSIAINQPKKGFEAAYRDILANTSWDSTAQKMSTIINKVLA